MKQILSILSIFVILAPAVALAEDTSPTVFESAAASAAYVRGAYDAMDSLKQDKISISQTQSGAVVTSVSLDETDGKTVHVARTNETTIPVGSNNSSTRAKIWVQ